MPAHVDRRFGRGGSRGRGVGSGNCLLAQTGSFSLKKEVSYKLKFLLEVCKCRTSPLKLFILFLFILKDLHPLVHPPSGTGQTKTRSLELHPSLPRGAGTQDLSHQLPRLCAHSWSWGWNQAVGNAGPPCSTQASSAASSASTPMLGQWIRPFLTSKETQG